MTQQFDVVCIGTGSAASTVASQCRAAGWTVAIIDKRPFGGTCALRGCDPKKVLVGAADVLDWARRMQGRGVQAEQLRLDWPDLMRFKRTFTEPTPKAREDDFRAANIATFHGPARFTGTNTLEVNGDIFQARYVVIATGAKPATLAIPGENLVTISDEFLELETLPPRIIFIGGGYISMEFAHVAAIAGAHVTIVHRGPRPLERFDPDLVAMIVAGLRDRGVDVQLNASVEAVESSGDALRLMA